MEDTKKLTPKQINSEISKKTLDILRYGRWGQLEKVEEVGREIAELIKHSNPTNSKNISLFFDSPSVKIDKNIKGLLDFFEAKHDLSSVFLDEELKEEIKLIIKEHQNIEKLKEFHTFPRHKLIFSGPPGVGKTLAAEALSKEMGLPLFKVDFSVLIDSHLGSTGKNISSLFDFVKDGPCILFIDEFEGISSKRNNNNDVAELRRVTNQLLLKMDTLPHHCLFITATNEKGMIDEAVIRRFDTQIDFTLPSDKVMGDLVRSELSLDKTPGYNTLEFEEKIIKIAHKNNNLSSVVNLCEKIRRELAFNGIKNIENIIEKELS